MLLKINAGWAIQLLSSDIDIKDLTSQLNYMSDRLCVYVNSGATKGKSQNVARNKKRRGSNLLLRIIIIVYHFIIENITMSSTGVVGQHISVNV